MVSLGHDPGYFSVFEWLCCVCQQTRLGPGPRQQGRQVQEEGFPTLGTERSAEWRGRSAAEVCTSEARKIGVLLRAPGTESLRKAWFPCISAKHRDCFVLVPALGVGVAGRNWARRGRWSGDIRGRWPTSGYESVRKVIGMSESGPA